MTEYSILGEFLLILNALFETHTLVEGLEGMMLDERDAVDLYVVDLGPELDPLVFLSPYDGPDVRAVDTYHAPMHFFLFQKLMLLALIDIGFPTIVVSEFKISLPG